MEDDCLRLPPMGTLRFFYVLGNEKSIRKAAAKLDVTHTAVIRQVRALEAWLGASLIETTSTGTMLNPQGIRFHRSIAHAFKEIADATTELRPPGQTRELRICAPPGFATFWILPRLHELQRQLPSVSFEIIPFEAERFDANEFDVEITYGFREDAGLVCRELARPRMIALASREWVARNTHVKTAADLAQVTLIHERLTDVWRKWFAGLGMHPTRLAGPRVGTLTTVLEAVHLDQGPGLFAEILADERLTRGRLVQVVADAPRGDAYSFVTTVDRYGDPAVRRFADWLEATLAPVLPEANAR